MAKRVGADKKRNSATLAEALGAELTDLRKALGLSQQALADRIGYDVGYVRRTELGANPTLQLLVAFADVFHIKLSDLILRAEKRVPHGRQ